MGLTAIACGRIERRIAKVGAVAGVWRSRLRVSRAAERVDRPADRQLQA